jgi:hypothetical protein
MASPLDAKRPEARPDGPSSNTTPEPAALMSVFSMFPQHEPEPEPEPAPAPVISPAEAALRALIVPIDTPTPSPPPPRNRERMQFGTVSTWQKQISPIEAPPPPAPMRVAASLESIIVANPPAPPEPSPPEPAPSEPAPPEPAALEPAPHHEPPPPPSKAAPKPTIIEPIAPPAASYVPEPEEGSEPQPEPFQATPAEPWPEPELPPALQLFKDPSPDNTALFASPPLAITEPANANPSLLSRPLLWQITTGICLAAAIAAITLPGKAPSATPLAIAAIGVVNAPAPLYLAESDSAGTLRLTALATIAVPNGRDLQLWIIPPGEQNPVSLGVLPSRGTVFTLPTPPTEGTRFVISMEPRGGTTTGRITGQVLYGGTLANR